MRKLVLFMNMSLDGYVAGPGGDIMAFHSGGDDFEAFSQEGSNQVDAILLGHTTYEMMKAYWPTPEAAAYTPDIARFMNERPKYVVSHQPFEPGWQHVTVISGGDVIADIRKLKAQPGQNIIILGSNNLCASLVAAGVLDEIQIMLNPFVFGGGTPLFEGLCNKMDFRLVNTQQFPSGNLLLSYVPK